jgi:2-polyprenyl-6-methoxyphenol hydroxylase-like FAD-dependent oxidoreductase
MQNFVIVGAGPIGLYMAIRLNKMIIEKNLDAKVTVLDPRAGQYERPGQVANMALAVMSQGLNREVKVESSSDIGNAMLIKDLEKSLHKIALENKVSFIKSSFEDFSGKAVKIKDDGTIP